MTSALSTSAVGSDNYCEDQTATSEVAPALIAFREYRFFL
jgi:hypothetical protein